MHDASGHAARRPPAQVPRLTLGMTAGDASSSFPEGPGWVGGRCTSRHAARHPPAQVPRLTLGMTAGGARARTWGWGRDARVWGHAARHPSAQVPRLTLGMTAGRAALRLPDAEAQHRRRQLRRIDRLLQVRIEAGRERVVRSSGRPKAVRATIGVVFDVVGQRADGAHEGEAVFVRHGQIADDDVRLRRRRSAALLRVRSSPPCTSACGAAEDRGDQVARELLIVDDENAHAAAASAVAAAGAGATPCDSVCAGCRMTAPTR